MRTQWCLQVTYLLAGISQRHHSVFFPYVKELKTDAETLIERFFNTVLLHKFPVADCTRHLMYTTQSRHTRNTYPLTRAQ